MFQLSPTLPPPRPPPSTCERVAGHCAPALRHEHPREGSSVASRNCLSEAGPHSCTEDPVLSDVASSPRQDSGALSSGLAQGSLPSLLGPSEPGRAMRSTAGVLPVCAPPELGASTKAPAAAGRVERRPCHACPGASSSAGSQASPPPPVKGRLAGDSLRGARGSGPSQPHPCPPPPPTLAPRQLCPLPGAVFCLGTLARAVPFAWNAFPALPACKHFLPAPTHPSFFLPLHPTHPYGSDMMLVTRLCSPGSASPSALGDCGPRGQGTCYSWVSSQPRVVWMNACCHALGSYTGY